MTPVIIGNATLYNCDCMEYMRGLPDTLNIRIDSMRGSYYDEDGIATHRKVHELIGTHSQTEIANKLGKHVAVINRMCKPDYQPHKTGARYLSDFFREPGWFNGL